MLIFTIKSSSVVRLYDAYPYLWLTGYSSLKLLFINGYSIPKYLLEWIARLGDRFRKNLTLVRQKQEMLTASTPDAILNYPLPCKYRSLFCSSTETGLIYS